MEKFIDDLLKRLIAEAFHLKDQATDDFEKGKLVGYYEAISKTINLAAAHGVYDKLSADLRAFTPEELLENLK